MEFEVKGTIDEILFDGNTVVLINIVTENGQLLTLSVNKKYDAMKFIIPGTTYLFKCRLFSRGTKLKSGTISYRNLISARQFEEVA